jgi:glycosyltransferase involved in cell wall biosynthesis
MTMRIAIVAQEYPPETAKGGIGTQAYAKAHGLARLGHDVTVISRSTTDQRQERADGKVRVIRVRTPHLEAYTEVADWVAYSAEVAAEIADMHSQTPLDLVEFPEWACEAYVHLLNRTDANQIPTVIQLHGPVVMLAEKIGWPEPGSDFLRIATQLEKSCLTMADAVYSSSACSADWCAGAYGLDRQAIPVLHSGVDTKHFAPRQVERDGRPTIVFAGKVTWNKGVVPLLEAAMQIAPSLPNLRLRMLGRGEKQVIADLHARAAAKGYPDLLELPGFVDRNTLPMEFSRADVFAAPSRYEGGPGFVYLEAMACGLPVIACEASGAAEVILPGKTGALVPPDDVNALADALRQLLAQKETLGRQAREHVVRNFDTESCVAKIAAYFQAVIAEHS